VLGLPQGDLKQLFETIQRNLDLMEEMHEPEVKPDGTVDDSQMQRYEKQETGKILTRRMGRKTAAQLQSGL